MLQSNTIFNEIKTGKLDSIEYGVYRCTISDDIRTQNVTSRYAFRLEKFSRHKFQPPVQKLHTEVHN